MDSTIYQLVVEQTKDYAVFVLDPEGRIATWNLGAERLKGYRPDEIIGKHFSVFYPHAMVERGWPDYELRTAAAEGRFEDEGWRIRKDGTRFWAAVTITALREKNGTLVGFSKITRDLSERKMQEAALQESEERFRLLVDGVVDYAIFVLDNEGIVTSWNTGAERIKGYKRTEIVGKHFSRFYTEEDRAAGKPWDELATARKLGRAEDEGWRVKKTGDLFWARVVITPLFDPEGRQRGFAKVTQDLSERRHLEDLETTARNVNEFIAMLAHELRNPLAPIRTAVKVMAQSALAEETREQMRQTIDRQSAQLSRIVDDLIDVSRITRGVLTFERSPVDITEAIGRAIETASPAIEAGKHTVDVKAPSTRLVVQGDIDRLSQLLTNLLTNAARYSDEGGRILVSATAENGNAVVRIRDTGHGIDPAELELIFHIFVQGRSSAVRRHGGLGIGLALARRLAEMHGGTLEALSEGPGKGSEFVLRIPLAETLRRSDRGPEAEKSPPRRVLVVDDNVDAAESMQLLLRLLGHDTQAAHGGTEGLALAGEFHPHVVLLDIGMPGMDGYEVARRLRAANGSGLRLVAVTGWGQEADRKLSQEAGFDLHLVKPVELGDLERALAP